MFSTLLINSNVLLYSLRYVNCCHRYKKKNKKLACYCSVIANSVLM